MRDFENAIRQRLPRLWLGREREGDVVSELASHLEDSANDGQHPEQICEGISWARFGRRIRRAKEDVMHRTKQIMIPALAALTTAIILELASVRYFLGIRSFVFPIGITAFVPQWPLLLTLPLAGAAGAFLARRLGASPYRRVLCALAPVGVQLAFFVILIIVGILNGDLRHASIWARIAAVVFRGVVIPAAPLMIGALPFLGTTEPPHRKDSSLTTPISA